MRVLLISQHFAPEDSPPAYRWHWLTSHFTAEGCFVDVVCSSWQRKLPKRQQSGKVTVRRIRNLWPGHGLTRRIINEGYVALRSALAALACPRPDVVVVTAPPVATMLLAHLICVLRRRPLILDLRDAWPELLDEWPSWSEEGYGPRPQPLRELSLRIAAPLLRRLMLRVRRRADLVVTTSSRLADTLPNTITVRNTSRGLEPLAARDWDGCLHVLYAGTVGRAQLLATAVRAAAQVKERGGAMVLRILGSGAHLPSLRRLAVELGAPVEFVPRTAAQDMPEHYRWADSLLVMLRRWPALEMTVPSKLYDAMSLGRHISASVAGETAEIVQETKSGSVTPPQDAAALADSWLGLIAEPQQLRVSGLGAEWLANNADPSQLARRYYQAVLEVANQ